MALILDPSLHMRRDGSRAIVYPKSAHKTEQNEFVYFLHPMDAMLLASFDGSRSESEVAAYWGGLFGADKGAAEKYVTNFLAKKTTQDKVVSDFLVNLDGSKHAVKYNLADFVVPANQVDMFDRRCQIPVKIMFLPTMDCVANCIYCYNDTLSGRRKGMLSLGRVVDLLKEARSLDIFTISFSGGDPFTRPDMFDILETIKHLGMCSQLPTKHPLSKTQIARLKALGDTVDLQISIDAVTPALLDMVIGVKGYHEGILQTLKDLADAGIPLRTNSVLMPCNIGDAAKLAEFLASLGNVRRIQMTPYTRSLYRHSDSLLLDEKSLDGFEDQLKTLREKYPSVTINFSGSFANAGNEQKKSDEESFGKRALCTAGLWGFVLLPNGEVTGCEEFCWHPKFIVGDVSEQSIMEMWRASKSYPRIFQDREKFAGSICESCEAFNKCIVQGAGRCVRDVMKAYGWENDNFPDPRCPLAPTGVRVS